jgi:uncharacterized membrane-anchored protein
MYNSKLPIIIFIVAAAMQLYVPANMILHREKILTKGKEYKFKTAPVDPNDPFRGKYIILNYSINNVKVEQKDGWQSSEPVYVMLSTDKDGYAKIDAVAKQQPAAGKDFVEAKIGYVSYDSILTIDYPFNRFYMEEAKAPDAENVYREYNRDTTHKTYALVSIREGEAVLKDVMIDGVSIKEIVRKNKKQ